MSTFLPFTENPSNRELVDLHRKGVQTFKSKVTISDETGEMKIHYDWAKDEEKLNGVKTALKAIPVDVEFVDLNFNQIKKTREKLNNIMKKLAKEEKFEECVRYKNIQTV